jgi:hypothetical protein
MPILKLSSNTKLNEIPDGLAPLDKKRRLAGVNIYRFNSLNWDKQTQLKINNRI